MDRIDALCGYLSPCHTFADVGCDHGYCTQYMLKNGLCERAYISDISPKSLQKAERLLKPFLEADRVKAVACFGLEQIPPSVDEVLIAGMGGEEIIDILKRGFIPEKFVFQPMKNAEKLRKFLLDSGCDLLRDDLFYCGKYYFCMTGVRSGDKPLTEKRSYTQAELKFGKGSLHSPILYNYLAEEIAKKEGYLLSSMSETNRAAVVAEIDYLKGVQCGDIT
jgi:tRNA (adenine22-N1)-methyltransferase